MPSAAQQRMPGMPGMPALPGADGMLEDHQFTTTEPQKYSKQKAGQAGRPGRPARQNTPLRRSGYDQGLLLPLPYQYSYCYVYTMYSRREFKFAEK